VGEGRYNGGRVLNEAWTDLEVAEDAYFIIYQRVHRADGEGVGQELVRDLKIARLGILHAYAQRWYVAACACATPPCFHHVPHHLAFTP